MIFHIAQYVAKNKTPPAVSKLKFTFKIKISVNRVPRVGLDKTAFAFIEQGKPPKKKYMSLVSWLST